MHVCNLTAGSLAHPSYATSKDSNQALTVQFLLSTWVEEPIKRSENIDYRGIQIFCDIAFWGWIFLFQKEKDAKLSVLALVFNEGIWYSGPDLLHLVSG